MTISEIERCVLSWQRIQKVKAKEQAAYDYILAAMVGRNVASYFGDVTVPDIKEVYSHLFEDEATEVQEDKIDVKTELSALRFKQFAKAHNDKWKS